MNKVLLVVEEYSELKSLESALKKVGFNVVGISSEFLLSQQILTFNPDYVISSGQGTKISSVGVGKRLKEMPRWQGHTILGFPEGFKPAAQDLIRIRMDSFFQSPAIPTRIISLLAKLTNQDEKTLLDKITNQANQNVSIEETENVRRKSVSFDLKEENIIVSGGKKKTESPYFPTNQSKDEGTEEGPFIAPDFNLLEKELESLVQSGSLPKPEKESDSGLAQGKKWEELIAKANTAAHGRLEKAKEALKAVKVNKVSQLSRTKTRKVQKDLMNDWDGDELKKQDQLRRDFTRVLFKKK